MGNFITKYGPWAVITGGTSGTGYQFALKLATQGFHLVLIARDEQALEETKERIESRYHVQVKTIATDLLTPDSISVIKKITQFIEVGLVINNAGYSITGEFHRGDWEDQSELLETIVKAPIALTHLFVNEMITHGRGGIIFVSSAVAYTSMPLWSVYSAGKAALLHFGESISQEVKKYNIDVLTVCPGAMKTKFQERSGIQSPILMEPEKVARLSLSYLGKKTTFLPGMTNRIIFQGLGRVLPNRIRLPLFESLMKKSQL
ncbi:short-subunit dehydrogenase [Sporosarcina luteola]|nr:short-subunit dehydrogenase [Sporosarcina luteola]